MTDSPITPGERLRTRRRELKISATELGRRAALIMGRDRPISPSAVRNQENGTNGLPMSVARAYSQVLKVESEWLLFGDRNLSPSESERRQFEIEQSTGEKIDLEDLRIATYGIISGRWLPEMVKPDHDEEQNYLFHYLPGWTSAVRLCAYEVADNTLEPTFPKGSWIITAPHEDTTLIDGTFVVAHRHKSDDIFQAVRMLKSTPSGVDLVSAGSLQFAPEPLLRGEDLVEGVWIVEAVICCIHYMTWGAGPPLDSRTALGPPSVRIDGPYSTVDHPKPR